MHALPPFQTDRRDLRHAHPDAPPSVSKPIVQIDLIDPTHGLALGCEAALPCLFDFTVEGMTPVD